MSEHKGDVRAGELRAQCLLEQRSARPAQTLGELRERGLIR